MSEQASEHQDRGLFGLFGKKKEEEGTYDDQRRHPPATHNYNQPQAQATHYSDDPYPKQGVEHSQGDGYEGQYNSNEAGQQKKTGLMAKLHGSGSGSSSSSDEEEEGKKKEGGRRKKGIKEKLPGARHSSDQYGREGEYGDGRHSSDQYGREGEYGDGRQSADQYGREGGYGDVRHSSDQYGREGGHGDGRHSSDQYGREGEYGDEGVKKEGLMGKIKDKLPGHRDTYNE